MRGSLYKHILKKDIEISPISVGIRAVKEIYAD